MLRKLKWPLLLGAIATVAAVLLLAAVRTQNQPLTIAFVGLTNAPHADRPLAAFIATNANSKTLKYRTHIERKTNGDWPVYFGSLPHDDALWQDVPAGREFRFLEYPPRDNAPWRISVLYCMVDDRWGQYRWRMAEFFYDRDFPALGRIFHDGGMAYLAVGPEITN